MTSQLVIFRAFYFIFFSSPDPKSEKKNPVNQLIKKIWPKASNPLSLSPPVKIIAKLETTQSAAQQNMEQTQNPIMGAPKHESTPTEPLPFNGQQPKPSRA